MKSKDVIAAIQKEDPSGETHMKWGDQGQVRFTWAKHFIYGMIIILICFILISSLSSFFIIIKKV